jgi:hypothetical protein
MKIIFKYYTGWKVSGSRPDVVIEFVLVYRILPAALWSNIYPASNRNEYQKQNNDVSEGVKSGRLVRLTT